MNDLERQDSPISPNLDGTGRPLLLLSWFVAHKLDPNSFVGAHVLLMVLIFGKGVTQYALLKRLLPERGLLAFLAAVLFVVYPADTGTADTRILNIHSAVLFFLLGVYLLVVCWQARNRWAAVGLGLAAAIAVTASLATYEAAYPLVIAAPLILLWLARQDVRRVIRRLALTMGLWYAGPAVYGIYWLRTTVGALPPYQNQLLLGGLRVENAASQMGAALLHAYWQGFWGGWVGAVSLTGSTYTGLAVLAALTIACCAWHVRHVVMPGAQSLGIAGAGLFVFFLGFLPYLPTSLRTDTWRVYLYASIGATCGVAALFSAHKAIGIGLISPLVVLGILSNLHEQQLFTDNSLAQERILEAIVKQAPQIHPGTLLLLLDDPADMSASRTFWANFYFE
ncbi:MAG TPA: hypothetical protein VMT24_01140, partial [Aggregatilineaceae bacterium]|nr:hypothetical protein [Aggregatilineaceae bacterium]